MNVQPRHLPPSTASPIAEALEGQVALRLTAALDAVALPHDVSERLRVARERAVAVGRAQRRTQAQMHAPAVVVQSAGGGRAALAGGPPPSIWWRMASAVPLVMLLGGLVLIQQYHDAEQITAAAEIDSALLADELPPAAYRDPGFAEYLRGAEAP